MYIWNQTSNIIKNNNIDKMKEYLIKHLKELITHYVNANWNNELYFNFINSKWNYVELKQIYFNDVSWDIYLSPLSAMYEDPFDWWEIIFQFSDDYYWIDIDEVGYYQEDYISYLKDKDKYIKDKVEYIIYLTW